jgi:hypothetical protein
LISRKSQKTAGANQKNLEEKCGRQSVNKKLLVVNNNKFLCWQYLTRRSVIAGTDRSLETVAGVTCALFPQIMQRFTNNGKRN